MTTSIEHFDITCNAVRSLESFKIPLRRYEYYLGEAACIFVFEACNLFAGADAASDCRIEILVIIGFGFSGFPEVHVNSPFNKYKRLNVRQKKKAVYTRRGVALRQSTPSIAAGGLPWGNPQPSIAAGGLPWGNPHRLYAAGGLPSPPGSPAQAAYAAEPCAGSASADAPFQTPPSRIKSKKDRLSPVLLLLRGGGFEPSTSTTSRWHSPAELAAHCITIMHELEKLSSGLKQIRLELYCKYDTVSARRKTQLC